MKKPIALLLSLVLLLGALPTASAAETARGATIRLEKTEGTVTLSNQNGTELPAQKNSKLYNGYALETEAASYAYFALDDKKAVKLDQTSAVTVKKTGKKLELLVAAGQLFFNVSAPLAADETMEIRTSSMVTGIRGTSGVVAQLDAATSRFYLFSGSAVLTDTDPATGVQRQVTVHAGESALSRHITTADGNLGEQVTLQGTIAAAEVPGFAAAAIAADPALQERIAAESSLDVTEIVNNALQTLQQEQQQKKQEIRQAERAEALRDNPPTLTTSTGDDGSSAPPSETPSPSTPTETSLIAADVTVEALRTALATYDKVTITAGGLEAPTLTVDAPFEIPSGKTLTINSGTIHTIEGAGLFTNHGTLVLADPLSVGAFDNY
ncbi:MAG: FecR domain-containing protein, partial [Oscillospiraceae bacterium]